MIMVSHDRAFLDATVTDIARLSEGNLDSGLILTVGGVCVVCVVGGFVGGYWGVVVVVAGGDGNLDLGLILTTFAYLSHTSCGIPLPMLITC